MQTINHKIWKKILGKDEVVRYEFSISNQYITVYGWVLIIITLPTILLPIIFAFYFFFYLKKSNVYAFTNKRVLIHRGWLSTNLISIDYHKITDIYVSESFFQRILTESGTIAIDTAGTSGEEIVLKNISNPYKVKILLDELKDK